MIKTTTVEGLVLEVINAMIAQGKPFSAYDVTTSARKALNTGLRKIEGRKYEFIDNEYFDHQRLEHNEVRDIVRNFDFGSYNYQSSVQQAPDGSSYIEFRPASRGTQTPSQMVAGTAVTNTNNQSQPSSLVTKDDIKAASRSIKSSKVKVKLTPKDLVSRRQEVINDIAKGYIDRAFKRGVEPQLNHVQKIVNNKIGNMKDGTGVSAKEVKKVCLGLGYKIHNNGDVFSRWTVRR